MIEKPLAFVGKIIADFTHEINNHLALIKESAGLISDICKGKKSIDKKEMPYVLESLEAIENQINRSVNFINYFNRFAHRMDNLKTSFKLDSAVQELFELLKRYSSRKKVSLNYNIPSNLPEIENSPFILEFAIFSVVDNFLRKSKPNAKIILTADKENSSIIIKINYEGEFEESSAEEIWQPSTIQEITAITNIRVSINDKSATIQIPG